MKVMPPKMLNQRKERSVANCVLGAICVLLAILLVFDLWFMYEFFAIEVDGESMETTLFDGDLLYADRYRTPERGDVVIIDVSAYRKEFHFSGDYIIKRVIALEGDTVKCVDGAVYLRKAGTEAFRPLDEPYVDKAFRTSDFGEVTVGEKEIFFLGDHRNNSTDSRVVGCLKFSDVIGVVPEWAIRFKKEIGAWESFRGALSGRKKSEQ